MAKNTLRLVFTITLIILASNAACTYRETIAFDRESPALSSPNVLAALNSDRPQVMTYIDSRGKGRTVKGQLKASDDPDRFLFTLWEKDQGRLSNVSFSVTAGQILSIRVIERDGIRPIEVATMLGIAALIVALLGYGAAHANFLSL